MKKILLSVLIVLISSTANTQVTDSIGIPSAEKKESKNDKLLDYIKKESVGGELDFNKKLENERGPLFLYEGTAYNKKDFAFLLWGMKVKQLGVKNNKEAVSLYETILKRTLTDPENRAITKGFNSKIGDK